MQAFDKKSEQVQRLVHNEHKMIAWIALVFQKTDRAS